MTDGLAGTASPASPAPLPFLTAARAWRPGAVPFVKWAGGKSSLLPQILPRIPERFGTYYEPFVGGGAVFFAVRPLRAVLADINAELIDAYLEVRDDPAGLMRTLDRYRYDRETYYRVRALQPATLSRQERAARFLYLNRTCYNGLYRVNRRGEFNVPMGRYPHPRRLYDPAVIWAASAALAHAEIRCASFEETLLSARAGDFVYLDPPYWPLDVTSSFTRYSQLGFTASDQQWLKAQVDRLTERGCRVLLSNSDTPFTRWLYAEYRIEQVHAPRPINADPTGRGSIPEILVRNYE
jgi:DNA adenine methylase